MSVEQQIEEFVNVELLGGNGASVDIDDNLLMTGHIDSLAMMRLVMFINTSTSVNVPPEDVTIENFMTIRAIATYLTSRGA